MPFRRKSFSHFVKSEQTARRKTGHSNKNLPKERENAKKRRKYKSMQSKCMAVE